MNQFDPRMIVTVVDATGIPPEILYYNMPGPAKELVTFSPDFERYVDPSYDIPRSYAERLLQNCGGRTYVLVSPLTLTIRVTNTRGGSDLKKINACVRDPLSGKWRQLADAEVESLSAAVKVLPMPVVAVDPTPAPAPVAEPVVPPVAAAPVVQNTKKGKPGRPKSGKQSDDAVLDSLTETTGNP